MLIYAVQCISATTFKEYHDCIANDQALLSRFQKVDVLEPSVNETIKILQGLRKKYEDFHRITYEDEALVAAAALSKKYNRFLLSQHFLYLIFREFIQKP